jgi:hypothetical protein
LIKSTSWLQYSIVLHSFECHYEALRLESLETLDKKHNAVILYTETLFLISSDDQADKLKINKLIEKLEEAYYNCVDFNEALKDLNVEMQKYLFKGIIEKEKVNMKYNKVKSIAKLIEKHGLDVSN